MREVTTNSFVNGERISLLQSDLTAMHDKGTASSNCALNSGCHSSLISNTSIATSSIQVSDAVLPGDVEAALIARKRSSIFLLNGFWERTDSYLITREQ